MMFRKLLIAGVMTSAFAVSFSQAQAADYTLRFSHQWPPVAGMQKELFQVWADTIEKESDGRIEVEMYPSATLAAPPAQYEAVQDGIADVAAAIQGYTANRFPPDPSGRASGPDQQCSARIMHHSKPV